jgi:hypothetical protein
MNERGLTLTELTVVTALATVIMLGMVGFYMSSQAMWMDASAQAITQREASWLADEIGRNIREAGSATITHNPDSLHCQLSLYEPSEIVPFQVYWWDPGDSLVHDGSDPSTDDRGAMVSSTVEVFQIDADSSTVDLRLLQLRSAQGQRVQITMRTAFQNR